MWAPSDSKFYWFPADRLENFKIGRRQFFSFQRNLRVTWYIKTHFFSTDTHVFILDSYLYFCMNTFMWIKTFRPLQSEIGLELAPSPYVDCGTMEGSSERHKISERYRNHLKSPTPKRFLSTFLMSFNNECTRTKYQDITCRSPRTREKQRVILWELWLWCNKNLPSSKHFWQSVLVVSSIERVRFHWYTSGTRSERID